MNICFKENVLNLLSVTTGFNVLIYCYEIGIRFKVYVTLLLLFNYTVEPHYNTV